MSFLGRRSRPSSVEAKPLPALPPGSGFPPPVEFKQHQQDGNGKKIIQRVSHMLQRKKRHAPTSSLIPDPFIRESADATQTTSGPRVTPIVVNPPPFSRWQIQNDSQSFVGSETDSIDDIRRPSGLGRSVSISSNRSMPPSPFMPDAESPFYIPPQSSGGRVRTISAPNLLRAFGIKTRTEHGPPTPLPSYVVPPLPNEVLFGIVSFLPRASIARLACTSQDFLTNVRIVLYEHLDLRTLKPDQIEALVTLLAYRYDLADLVRSLECHTWPTFFPPHPNICGLHLSALAPSFSPALTATFTIAFQNMRLITWLLLPSFDPTFLRHHSAFGLRKITFLTCAMSPIEKTQLFTWLDGQTNITHLSFPNLMDEGTPLAAISPRSSSHLDVPTPTGLYPTSPRNSASDMFLTPLTPSLSTPASPALSFASPETPPEMGPLSSPTLLPSLATITATPSIITSLMQSGRTLSSLTSSPVRPLRDVTVNINKTLYTGLRPSSLMNALRSANLDRLVLRFGPAVDRRTVGKVVTASAVLFNAGGSSASSDCDEEDEGIKSTLTELEVELADPSEGADQALYKVLNTILPRYRGLVNLQLRFAPESHSSSSSSSAAVVIVAQTSKPGVMPERPLPVPPSMDRDDAQSKLWSKHCPSLQTVRLLSGAVWKRT